VISIIKVSIVFQIYKPSLKKSLLSKKDYRNTIFSKNSISKFLTRNFPKNRISCSVKTSFAKQNAEACQFIGSI